MNEEQKLQQMIEGKDKHFSDAGFLNKMKHVGAKLGFKGLHAAATLYVALKSPSMSKTNKMIILGALGYFILPIDLVVDILPFVGLSDDLFVVTAALAKVVMSIDDDMKQEAHGLLKNTFGDRYDYEEEFVIKDVK